MSSPCSEQVPSWQFNGFDLCIEHVFFPSNKTQGPKGFPFVFRFKRHAFVLKYSISSQYFSRTSSFVHFNAFASFLISCSSTIPAPNEQHRPLLLHLSPSFFIMFRGVFFVISTFFSRALMKVLPAVGCHRHSLTIYCIEGPASP